MSPIEDGAMQGQAGTQIDDLVKMLRVTTERMANVCSVDMETWNEHSNAALSCADALEAQAAELTRLREQCEAKDAEIERLKAVISWANNSLYGSHTFFLSLQGGIPDNEHHLDAGIEKLKEQNRKYYAENERLRKALEDYAQAVESEKKVLYEALERALSHFVVIGGEHAKRAAEEIEAILNG